MIECTENFVSTQLQGGYYAPSQGKLSLLEFDAVILMGYQEEVRFLSILSNQRDLAKSFWRRRGGENL